MTSMASCVPVGTRDGCCRSPSISPSSSPIEATQSPSSLQDLPLTLLERLVCRSLVTDHLRPHVDFDFLHPQSFAISQSVHSDAFYKFFPAFDLWRASYKDVAAIERPDVLHVDYYGRGKKADVTVSIVVLYVHQNASLMGAMETLQTLALFCRHGLQEACLLGLVLGPQHQAELQPSFSKFPLLAEAHEKHEFFVIPR